MFVDCRSDEQTKTQDPDTALLFRDTLLKNTDR